MKGGLEALDRAGHQAAVLGNLVRALELCGAAYEAGDPELRHHLRRLCGWILQRLEPHHAPEVLAGRLELPAAQQWPSLQEGPAADQVGQVDALFLDSGASEEAFLVRLVVSDGVSTGRRLPANAGPALAEAIRRAEQAVLGHLLRRGGARLDPARLTGCVVALEGPRAIQTYATADGGSIGAAAAVALFSRWTGRPVPAELAITGQLGADLTSVEAVDGVEAKVACALRERPRLRAVVIPRGTEVAGGDGDERVRQVGELQELLEAVFGVEATRGATPRRAVEVEGTVRMGLELYEKAGAFGAAFEVLCAARGAIEEQRAARGQPGLFRVEEFLCLWRQGACLIHRGDPHGARELLERARRLGEALWSDGELDPRSYFGLRGNLAVLLRDLFDYGAAERLLRETLAQQRALRQDKRELAKTLGNLGELLTFSGDLDRAEQRLGQALAALRAVYPDEVPRELCYLGNLHLRRGDPHQAAACYEEGLNENRTASYGRARNEVFLRYGLARARLLAGRPRRALGQVQRGLALLDDPTEPYPRQFLLKVAGLSRLALGGAEQARGVELLRTAADPTHVRGPLARLGVATALAELARHLIAAGDGLAGAWREARAFVEGAGELLDPMCGAGYRARVLQLVEGAPAVEAAAALDRELRLALERFPY